MTSEPLEGMYIYTRDSVYEVRSRVRKTTYYSNIYHID
jgi:hypothetical protein